MTVVPPSAGGDSDYGNYLSPVDPKADSKGQVDLSHYKPKYKIDVETWKKFLKFKNVQLTDKEVHAMADGMIDFFINFMNQMMQHALQAQKDNEKIASGDNP